MVKKQKEKQEIERELEGFEKKLLDYEDSDELSVDLNQAAKEKEEFFLAIKNASWRNL